MKLTRRTALTSAAAGVALFSIGSPAAAKATRMRFAHPHPTSDSWQAAALQFAERIKTDTDGEYEVQVFPNGGLGSDQQIIGAVRGGSIDFCITGNPYFTGLAPVLNVLDLPFLFQSRDHVAAVMDGPIGDGMRSELEGSNIKALSTWDIGWRNLTNDRRAVATPDDIRGLKLRTTPNPAHIKAFQLLGASPTPMAFTELFTALETGTVDGQENPVTLILNARFYEVQKHLSLTRHAFTTAPLCMNNDKFAAYPAALQDVLLGAARDMAVTQRQMNEDAEATSLAELKTAGMEVVEEPDRAAFAEIVTEAVEQDFVATFGTDLLDQIKGAAS
jgi:tripartite ATP-independent transporter DctP family solute receptor